MITVSIVKISHLLSYLLYPTEKVNGYYSFIPLFKYIIHKPDRLSTVCQVKNEAMLIEKKNMIRAKLLSWQESGLNAKITENI